MSLRGVSPARPGLDAGAAPGSAFLEHRPQPFRLVADQAVDAAPSRSACIVAASLTVHGTTSAPPACAAWITRGVATAPRSAGRRWCSPVPAGRAADEQRADLARRRRGRNARSADALDGECGRPRPRVGERADAHALDGARPLEHPGEGLARPAILEVDEEPDVGRHRCEQHLEPRRPGALDELGGHRLPGPQALDPAAVPHDEVAGSRRRRSSSRNRIPASRVRSTLARSDSPVPRGRLGGRSRAGRAAGPRRTGTTASPRGEATCSRPSSRRRSPHPGSQAGRPHRPGR